MCTVGHKKGTFGSPPQIQFLNMHNKLFNGSNSKIDLVTGGICLGRTERKKE